MFEPGVDDQLQSVVISQFQSIKDDQYTSSMFYFWLLYPVVSSFFDKGPAGGKGYGLKVPASATLHALFQHIWLFLSTFSYAAF